jgi:ankyrin repeat protein
VIAEQLLEAGAAINRENQEGRTALHVAAYHGQSETISTLLGRGAVAGPDTRGRTPLDLALERGHAEAAELLR